MCIRDRPSPHPDRWLDGTSPVVEYPEIFGCGCKHESRASRCCLSCAESRLSTVSLADKLDPCSGTSSFSRPLLLLCDGVSATPMVALDGDKLSTILSMLMVYLVLASTSWQLTAPASTGIQRRRRRSLKPAPGRACVDPSDIDPPHRTSFMF